MNIPVGSLAKGVIGTSLLGGGITSGALYENSKKNYSDFLKKFEEIVVSELEQHRLAQEIKVKESDSLLARPVTLKCVYWTDVEYSTLTKEEKLLKCIEGWNKKLKDSFKVSQLQMKLFAKTIDEYFTPATATKA